jgi:ribulose-phosphate 3-epimerase
MIEHPEALAPAFRKAGADQITVHLEACRAAEIPVAKFDPARLEPQRVHAALDAVHRTGAKAGLALKPATPFEVVTPFLDAIDVLLIMTVEPGFGGQAFMSDMLPKIRAAADWKQEHDARWLIEVDGGIAPDTAPICREAGAEVFVAGQAIYGSDRPLGSLTHLRDMVETARARS